MQKTADLAFLAKWRSRGEPLDTLHERINLHLQPAGRKLSKTQVYEDLKLVDQAWRDAREKDVTTLRDGELAKLDIDEAELLEAWEKSKTAQIRRKNVNSGRTGADGGFIGTKDTVQTVESSDSYGDPAIMAQIMSIRRHRAALCGWIAPQRVQHAGHDGGALPVGTAVAPIVTVTIAPPPEAKP
jgi:hypothetical protein